MGFDLIPLLKSILWSAPSLAINMIGMVLSVVFWNRHPKVSMVALAAFFLLFSNLLGGIVGPRLIISLQGGPDFETVSHRLELLNGFRGLVAASGQGLLLVAVFGWRYRLPPNEDIE